MTYHYDAELAEVVPFLPTGMMADPVAARQGIADLMASMNIEIDTSALEIEDRKIDGAEGAPQVLVRVYQPRERPAAIVPGLVYIHGGGFVVGNLETEHAGAVKIADELGIVVVSVDYRLAPEDPFPAGLDDCYAALQWLHASADELGVDSARIGVMGGSAGGGLAAGLALLARDRGGPSLCFQFLGIPELDDRLETPSMRQFTDTPLWNRPSAIQSWAWYLGLDAHDDHGDVSPYASPARATNLGGLPPAFVSTMQYDPLRDEGIMYAMRMLEAGVPVELHQYPGTFHGSSLVTTAAVSKRQAAEMVDVLRRGLNV